MNNLAKLKPALAAVAFLTAALSFGPAGAQTLVGDSVAGGKTFNLKCTTCHTATPDKKNAIGPSLYGVVGRKAGTAPGFAYSPGMKALGQTWTPANIDIWLSGPNKVVADTKMILVPITDAQTRADLIAYLKDQAPAPKKKSRRK